MVEQHITDNPYLFLAEKKMNKYSCNNSSNKKLLLVASALFVLIIMIALVSAASYSKTFTKDASTSPYGKIQIREIVWGIPLGTYATYELLDNTDECLIECSATGIVNLEQDGTIFDDMIFKDGAGDNINLQSHKVFIQVEESYDDSYTEKYKMVCDNKNSSGTVCWNEPVIKIETKKRNIWKEYQGENLKKGFYKWKLEGQKNRVGERIDWIPKINNIELSEWAWWNTNWLNAKQVNITGPQSATLSNFTIFLNVTYVTGKMQVDFEDLRFINGTCSGPQTEELDYEFDRVINSSSAGVWVRMPKLANGANPICMYYNNPSAARGEDPSNTWDIYYKAVFHFTETGDLRGTMMTARDSITGNNFSILGSIYPWNPSYTVYYTNSSFGLGNSLYFNGGGLDGVELNASMTLADFAGPYLTIEAFGLATYNDRMIVGSTTNGYAYYLSGSNFRFAKAGVSTVTSGSTIGLNVPIYMALVYNSTEVFFYQNQSSDINNPQAFSQTFSTGLDYYIGRESAAAANSWRGELDEVRIQNLSRISNWINRSNQNNNMSYFNFENEIEDISLTINLFSPSDLYTTTLNSITFNCSANATAGIINLTLIIDNVANHSVYNTTAKQNYSLQVTKTLIDGSHTWTCNTSNGSDWKSATQRTLTVDSIKPTINITQPLTSYNLLNSGQNLSLNFSVVDTNRQACWFEYNGVNTTLNCAANSSFLYVSGVNKVNLWANDSVGNTVNLTRSWTVTNVFNSVSYSPSTFETATESFIANVTGTSTASFIYGGTTYTPTISGDIINATIGIPSGVQNRSFYFKINGGLYNTSTYNQTVNETIFGICNQSTFNVTYLFINFQDEYNNSYMGATIDSSTFNYTLGGMSSKSSTFLNTTANNNYSFCGIPSDKTINVTYEIRYSNGVAYPQRSAVTTGELFTNVTTNRTLLMLSTSHGIYTSFQTLTAGRQTISGVHIVIQRDVGGVLTTVGDDYTDSSGMATFFLNPNYDITVTASKSGYPTQVLTIRPTASTYTILMGSATTPFYGNYSLEGVWWSKSPPSGPLESGQYNFSFMVFSNNSNLQGCNMSLTFTNGTYIKGLSGCTTDSRNGVISFLYNVSTNYDIYGEYWINLGGTWALLERDARWKEINISRSGMGTWSTMKGFFYELVNTPEWGTNDRTKDFNKIVFFFLFLCVIIAVFNFFTQYDTAYPGSAIFILAILVVAINIGSGVTGPGYFYMDESVRLGCDTAGNCPTSTQILNNWILPIHFAFLAGIYYFTTNRRYQS